MLAEEENPAEPRRAGGDERYFFTFVGMTDRTACILA